MSFPDVLTVEQVREVDRRAVEEWGVPSIVLMENAGRGCVDVMQRRGLTGPVMVCCGKGNNGGDGLVVARHLHIRGVAVGVLLFCDPTELKGDAAINFAILEKTKAPINRLEDGDAAADALETADWVVDALLGTGATGSPRSPLDEAIRRMNDAVGRKLAVDAPSGFDAQTGEVGSPTFEADVTCTFVAAKPGFHVEGAEDYVGELEVLDIGAPPELVWAVAKGN